MREQPIALLIAFAIRLWFTGRRPVSFLCLIRPISVMYSDIMLKFCERLACCHFEALARQWLLGTHFVMMNGIDAQLI
jgi:hypothetical protein